MSTAVVVLCGGTSARMGGVDKTAADLRGRTVLDTLLDSLPGTWPVVCVGVPRPTARAVTWTREDPPLSGPVSGLAAGLAAAPQAEVVVVLAGDQPFSGATAAACADALHTVPLDVDGVAARQTDGRLQPLLAAYRRPALAAALDAAPDRDAGVHRTLAHLTLDGLTGDPLATLDVDTPDDLDTARDAGR